MKRKEEKPGSKTLKSKAGWAGKHHANQKLDRMKKQSKNGSLGILPAFNKVTQLQYMIIRGI